MSHPECVNVIEHDAALIGQQCDRGSHPSAFSSFLSPPFLL
jgi:hypothetical protein